MRLTAALGEQEVTKEFLGTVKRQRKIGSRKGDMMQALSEHFSMPLVVPKNRYIGFGTS